MHPLFRSLRHSICLSLPLSFNSHTIASRIFSPACSGTLRTRFRLDAPSGFRGLRVGKFCSSADEVVVGDARQAVREDEKDERDAAHVPELVDYFEGRRRLNYAESTLGAGDDACSVLSAHSRMEAFVEFDASPPTWAHAEAQPRLQQIFKPRSFCSSSSDVQLERPEKNTGQNEFDVVIVGGGMVGAAVGCGLASSPLTRSLRVAIVEGNPATMLKYNKPKDAVPDARVSAITPATVRFLQGPTGRHFHQFVKIPDVGAWENIQESRHAPFDSMQVWDYSGRGFTRYKAADVGEPVLGYVVENNVLISALNSALGHTGFAEKICPAKVKGVQFPAGSTSLSTGNVLESFSDRTRSYVGASTSSHVQENVDVTSSDAFVQNDNWAQVLLEDGRLLRTRLVVGADGGRSRVRDMAGLETRGWDYNQHALICTVRVGYHHSTAWQRFLPTGPLALLPVGDNLSNIVWSTTPEKAKALKEMSSEEFVTSVNRAFTEDYGPLPSSQMSAAFMSKWFTPIMGELPPSVSDPFTAPPPVTSCLSDRLSFPLSLRHATKYVSNRLALVGDAAHTVHPLAGQGVNLGFGDAATLVKILREGVQTGEDIGELGLLEKYEKERLWANLPMMAVLDGFQRVFGTDFPPVNLARAAGFYAVQYLGPLKKKIISFAMGG